MIRHYYYGFLCREGAQPSAHNCGGVEYINNPVISGDLLLLVRITEAALDGKAGKSIALSPAGLRCSLGSHLITVLRFNVL